MKEGFKIKRDSYKIEVNLISLQDSEKERRSKEFWSLLYGSDVIRKNEY